MKSFQQFVSEAKEVHDREGLGGGTGMTHRTQTGKIGSERKKSELTTQLKQHKGQKKRVKAVGGGKTVETGGYKKRKDAGLPLNPFANETPFAKGYSRADRDSINLDGSMKEPI